MTKDGPIVLFDGYCGFCSGVVRFIIRRDREARFQFAPVTSPAGTRLLSQYGVPAQPNSIVVIDRGQALLRSDASLAIAAGLPAPWRWLAHARLVPRPLRDAAYAVVARVRYRLAGRSETCLVPTAEQASRFLSE